MATGKGLNPITTFTNETESLNFYEKPAQFASVSNKSQLKQKE